MYNCKNCKHQIKIGLYKCPFCSWFNLGAGKHELAQIDFKHQLIYIAIKLARPKTQSITIFKIQDITYRIIALDNDTQIITSITNYDKEG